jgi:hypothetical protein
MNTQKKTTILTNVFDFLSSIPYLLKCMKMGVPISAVLVFFSLLGVWGSSFGKFDYLFMLGFWVFAYFVEKWNRRDLDRQKEEASSK